MRPLQNRESAFTLIELLVVIAIIIILAGLLFPAYQAVQNQAKRTQAKNDLTQVVNAVNAFYTEYGRYPTTATNDVTYGPAGTTNNVLFDELRACHLENGVLTDPSCSAVSVLNTRLSGYISPPAVKDPTNPLAGIGIPGTGAPTPVGRYWDPWGTPYNVRIDGDYNNSTTNPYGSSGGAGVDPVQQGVIAWSYGKDRTLGTLNPPSSSFINSDDVISWQ